MQPVSVLSHPLTGTSLIEASAGTGKTWTIAALYLRLILGVGEPGCSFSQPLTVRSILVMTFTRAATRELVERIQSELQQAADCFSQNIQPADKATYKDLWHAISHDDTLRRSAAQRLRLAAECMDEAAVMTIDAWCQRMLREHAFASGAGFDDEILDEPRTLTEESFQDVWRWFFYGELAHDIEAIAPGLLDWKMDEGLKQFMSWCAQQDRVPPEQRVDRCKEHPRHTLLNACKTQLALHIKAMEDSFQVIRNSWPIIDQLLQSFLQEQDWPFNNKLFKNNKVAALAEQMNRWCTDRDEGQKSLVQKQLQLRKINKEFKTPLKYLHPENWANALKKDYMDRAPSLQFDALSRLTEQMAADFSAIDTHLTLVVFQVAYQLLQRKKESAGRWSFDDVQRRLLLALNHSEELVGLIRQQFPVVLIDEYQDTSQIQYQIFKTIYPDQQANDYALVLIGDPKQSIYRFRGADIHAYLRAKAELSPSCWFSLPSNYRSTGAVVAVVNDLFSHAEARHDAGAFKEKQGGADQPSLLSFEPVHAVGVEVPDRLSQQPALQVFWLDCAELQSMNFVRAKLAEHAANAIQTALTEGVRAEDIAVLVRNKSEADLLLKALRQRGVASVYLSGRESVWSAEIAVDLLRWLKAAAEPQNIHYVRSAVACTLTALDLETRLHAELHDERILERWMNWFGALHQRWLQQGVLAMLTYAMQSIVAMNPGWFEQADAERWLTDVQHLAELAQAASVRLQGMTALLLWFQKQVEEQGQNDQSAETMTIRLEREEKQVRILTIHKSKGLEFGFVFIPFALQYKEYKEVNKIAKNDRALEEEKEQEQEQMLREDIRLLYVALTRAKYALWLGLADQKFGRDKTSIVPKTAFGYLLGLKLTDTVSTQDILAWVQEVFQFDAAVRILHQHSDQELISCVSHQVDSSSMPTVVAPMKMPQRSFWQLSSYSRLLHQISGIDLLARKDADEPHRSLTEGVDLPAGRAFGSRLHQALELLAQNGFAEHSCATVVKRCFQMTPWANQMERLQAWLSALIQVSLPEGACLGTLRQAQCFPEMEFYMHVPKTLDLAKLDDHCRSGLLAVDSGQTVVIDAVMDHASLQGMLTGVMDLVYEWDNRYWIVDYKSNKLADYKRSSLTRAAAEHRYDVQAALYLLTLHRHLRHRLKHYDPEKHLGGYLLWFVRGHDQSGHGVLDWRLNIAWLTQLEQLMPDGIH